MPAATILMIVQILSAVAGTEWTLAQLISLIQKDGDVQKLGNALKALFQNKATVENMQMLQDAFPELHQQAVFLLGN